MINKISNKEENEKEHLTQKKRIKKKRNFNSLLNPKRNINQAKSNISNNNFKKEENMEDLIMNNSKINHEELMNLENKNENEEISTKKNNNNNNNINNNQIPKEKINEVKEIINIEKNEESKIEIPENLEKEYKQLLEIIQLKDEKQLEQFFNIKKYYIPTPKEEEIDKKAEILKYVLKENIYLKNSISSNTEKTLELSKENGILESKLDEINWTIGHLNEVLSEQKIRTMELKDKLGLYDNSNNSLFVSNQGLV